MARDPGHSRKFSYGITEDDVVAYLRDNPDFLSRHGELCDVLAPPSVQHGQGVVDFQSFMVERLRSEVGRLREQQQSFLDSTRAHLNMEARIHAAVLALTDARSLEQAVQIITHDFAVYLDLDIVCLIVEALDDDVPRANRSGVRVVEAGTLDQWLGRRDLIVRNEITGDSALFAAGAGLVRSEALIRLRISPAAPNGLLAFGSRRMSLFEHLHGNEPVVFLGKMVERAIRSWLDF